MENNNTMYDGRVIKNSGDCYVNVTEPDHIIFRKSFKRQFELYS